MKAKYPIDYNNLSDKDKESWKSFTEVFPRIKKLYKLKEVKVNDSIKSFKILASKHNPFIYYSWKVNKKNLNFHLNIIDYQINEYSSNDEIEEYPESHKYFYGFLKIKNDYGNTLIRPETLEDKLRELIDPVEIDFPNHKKFSNMYYVLTEDKNKLLKVIDEELLVYLSAIKNIVIEFKTNSCLFRLPKAINYTESLQLCEIGLRLDEILNHKNPKINRWNDLFKE